MRPSDAIWRQWSWTTLAQVTACCLTAPSHYLNQCWLIIRGVLWHTSESSFAGIAQGIDSGYEFEKDILKNIFKSPRGQWVKLMYQHYSWIWPINVQNHHPSCYHLCQIFGWLNMLVLSCFIQGIVWVIGVAARPIHRCKSHTIIHISFSWSNSYFEDENIPSWNTVRSDSEINVNFRYSLSFEKGLSTFWNIIRHSVTQNKPLVTKTTKI